MAGENRQRGMACPKCGKREFRVVGRYRPMRNVRVRYFLCVPCGAKWKSTERFTSLLN